MRVMETSWDYDLIKQVAAGDDNAFVLLYERYFNSIHGFVMSMLRDPSLSEEVTQDTFVKVWRWANQYLGERGSVHDWLLTIARHTALDYLRKQARAPLAVECEGGEELALDIPDANTFTEEARWRSMRFAIASLPQEQRQVVELFYYQGFSQSEIAAELGWPLGTVKTRLRNALEQLRHVWVENV
jgi:RNA polymerase sigma-70 factor, ECF subfamily